MKKFGKLLSCTRLLLFSSCTVYHSQSNLGTYTPSPSNNYSGLYGYEPFADTVGYMQTQCSAYGGLDFSSVRQSTDSKYVGNNLGLVKAYKCYGPRTLQPVPVYTPVPSPALPRPTLGLEGAKSKCQDLGFKSGTEDFGRCVLKLSE